MSNSDDFDHPPDVDILPLGIQMQYLSYSFDAFF